MDAGPKTQTQPSPQAANDIPDHCPQSTDICLVALLDNLYTDQQNHYSLSNEFPCMEYATPS